MGCSCNNTSSMSSVIPGENYGIYGYLPTEYTQVATPSEIIQGMLFIGLVASVAYFGLKSVEKKKSPRRRTISRSRFRW